MDLKVLVGHSECSLPNSSKDVGSYQPDMIEMSGCASVKNVMATTIYVPT